VRNEIERLVREFLDGLTALAVQEKIVWTDPESPIDEMFQSALRILLTTFGSLEISGTVMNIMEFGSVMCSTR
jgi:hypothetical protein